MKAVWEDQYTLCTWDVDASKRLTMAGAFNYFQESAGAHAENMGVGRLVLMKAGQAWILSRMSVCIRRRPVWGDRVRVRTWPRGTQKLFAIRDYELSGETGDILAQGRSAWLVVDTAKLKPLRPQSLTTGIPLNEGMDALADGAQSLEPRSDAAMLTDRRAAYSDMDYNGHVNNARYVQWIQDALPAAEIEGAESMRLDINFLSELKYGNRVDLFGAPINGQGYHGYSIEGRSEGNGRIDAAAFRAELRLNP
jgi:acyl-ACP thioesterase